MSALTRAVPAGGGAGLACAAVLVAAAVAQAPAPAPASTGVATYEVFAFARGALRLCPGQSLQIRVGVNQVTTRTGAVGRVSSARSLPNAQVTGLVANQAIGTLDPAGPVSIGSTPSIHGGFYWPFIFTAKKIGTTTIDFRGVVLPAALTGPQSGLIRASPARTITVEVACNYSISLYSVWQLPGERLLDVMGVVQSARLVPNSTGRFSTQATMSSSALWIGGCPGSSTIQRSGVTIYGELGAVTGSLGMAPLKIKVLYAPVSSRTTEGCIGKSRTDQGQAEPLELEVDQYGGTLTPSHVMNTYVRAVGSTTVVVTRLP
jgi:hypothetical protein